MINQSMPDLAAGSVCVYCGRPAWAGGRLVPLRPSVRAATRLEVLSHVDITDRALAALHMDRCEPPCDPAVRAYRDSFRD